MDCIVSAPIVGLRVEILRVLIAVGEPASTRPVFPMDLLRRSELFQFSIQAPKKRDAVHVRSIPPSNLDLVLEGFDLFRDSPVFLSTPPVERQANLMDTLRDIGYRGANTLTLMRLDDITTFLIIGPFLFEEKPASRRPCTNHGEDPRQDRLVIGTVVGEVKYFCVGESTQPRVIATESVKPLLNKPRSSLFVRPREALANKPKVG